MSDLIVSVSRYAVYSDGAVGATETVSDYSNLVLTLNGYSTPEDAYDNRGDKSLAYMVQTLDVKITGIDVTTEVIMKTDVEVYIGVKGDADLDGDADAADASVVLVYAAQVGAGNNAQIYSGSETYTYMEDFVYFLADVDGESTTHGSEYTNDPLNASDASFILVYAAREGAELNPEWEYGTYQVLQDPLPWYSQFIADWKASH